MLQRLRYEGVRFNSVSNTSLVKIFSMELVNLSIIKSSAICLIFFTSLIYEMSIKCYDNARASGFGFGSVVRKLITKDINREVLAFQLLQKNLKKNQGSIPKIKRGTGGFPLPCRKTL